MAAKIAHRGPDDHGIWSDREAGTTLAHQRLSIIDVSAAGHQPMVSASARYVISFNGEIYNFTSLRDEIERSDVAPVWRGQSDTEVLLAAIDAWGVQATIERAQGMFALAVWDRHVRALTLARDPMGEKPLYFGWIGRDFAFASELKALAAHPDWAPSMDKAGVRTLLELGYCVGARTLVSNIFRLPAGTSLTLSLEAARNPSSWESLAPRTRRYWDLGKTADEGLLRPWEGTRAEAADELNELLTRAVQRQMVADVPLGAFLSGGIDSSLVVALMQKHSVKSVRTFCVGFDDPAHDEAVHARKVAKYLGTDHEEIYVTDRQALELVPTLPTVSDEPLADTSQIPTLLVCRLARRHVTVALTGDGGDELFAGYTRYPAILRYWSILQRLPVSARRRLSSNFQRLAASDEALAKLPRWIGARLLRVAARHQGSNLPALRLAQMSGPGRSLLLSGPTSANDDRMDAPAGSMSALRQLLLMDQVDYLPNDILTKVDRAAMSVGLETRVPLLDPTVVAFSWRLPDDWLLERGYGKSLLREIAYLHVPRELLERPKQGFAPPVGLWLRGALRPWAEALLDRLPASLEGVIDVRKVGALWRHHQDGWLDLGYPLWRLLTYVAWAREYRVGL